MKGLKYIGAVGVTLFAATTVLAQSETGGDAPATTGSMSVEVLPSLVATVLSLRRLPDTSIVQLDYRLENIGDRTISIEPLMVTGNGALSAITLLDFVGEDTYYPGSAGGCLCSMAPPDRGIAGGASFEGWAWFMPPESLDGSVAVQFGDQMPILDVPIE